MYQILLLATIIRNIQTQKQKKSVTKVKERKKLQGQFLHFLKKVRSKY